MPYPQVPSEPLYDRGQRHHTYNMTPNRIQGQLRVFNGCIIPTRLHSSRLLQSELHRHVQPLLT